MPGQVPELLRATSTCRLRIRAAMVNAVCCATVAPTPRHRSASSSAISRQTAFAAPIAWSRVSVSATRRISVRLSALSFAGILSVLQTRSASCLGCDYAWHVLASLVEGMAGGGVRRRRCDGTGGQFTKLPTEGQSAPCLPQTALDGNMLTAWSVLPRRSHCAARVNNLTGEFPQSTCLRRPITGSTGSRSPPAGTAVGVLLPCRAS